MTIAENVKKFLNKYAIIVLIVAIFFYVVIFFGISYYKYNNFYYDSLDLAIFNQVFYNTSQGRLFQLSIHAPTYLGDHFTPVILFLAPLYSFYRSPLALLFLQTFILALSVWPIYLITKKAIGGRIVPLMMGLVWLINPLVQNANLFEFHLLPFATFLLLWVFYFYLEKKWWLFFLFVFLSLLVREDVSLVVFMFGVLAIIDFLTGEDQDVDNSNIENNKRTNFKGLFFGIILCLLSVFWLILGLKITGHYTYGGQYKFLFYYSWLGNFPSEIIFNLFFHPILVLRHLITIYNVEMLLGLLFAFCFLPLLSKKYLILLLGPLLQIMIGGPGGSALILQTHYNLLMLPALMISFIYGFKRFLYKPLCENSKFSIIKILAGEKIFLTIILIIGLIYCGFGLGPLVGVAEGVAINPPDKTILGVKKEFLAEVPKNSSVATTYEYLNNLSSRQKVYSMHYAFIGKTQYCTADYKLPEDTEYLLIDFNDFFIYNVQFPDVLVYKEFFNLADDNMRELFKHYRLVKIFDNQALFELSKNIEETPLYKVTDEKPINEQDIELEDKIKFIGWEPLYNNPQEGDLIETDKRLLPISLFFKAQTNLASNDPKEPSKNYQLKMLITNSNDEVLYEKFYPLAYGIFPTSEWPLDKNVKINYRFYIPENFGDGENILQFSLAQVSGHIELDSFRRSKPVYTETFLKPNLVIEKIKNLR